MKQRLLTCTISNGKDEMKLSFQLIQQNGGTKCWEQLARTEY